MTDAATTQGAAADLANQNAAATGANEQPKWFDNFQDTEVKGWLGTKGYQSPEEVAKAHWSLEKMFGADRAGRTVVIPGDKAEASELDQFFSKLGRPETPDKYELELPENSDEKLVGWFKEAAHKHGLTNKQAKAFLSEYNAMVGGRAEETTREMQTRIAEEDATLKREWGAAFDQNLARAKQAAQTFGATAEQIDVIEKAMGKAGVMKLFANIGAKIGEGGMITPQSTQQFGGVLAPEQAQAKMNALKADKDWLKAYLSGSKPHIAEMDQLMQWAYPNGR